MPVLPELAALLGARCLGGAARWFDDAYTRIGRRGSLARSGPFLQVFDPVDDTAPKLQIFRPRAIGPMFFERPMRKPEYLCRLARSQIAQLRICS